MSCPCLAGVTALCRASTRARQPAMMTETMRRIGDVLPLTHAVRSVQNQIHQIRSAAWTRARWARRPARKTEAPDGTSVKRGGTRRHRRRRGVVLSRYQEEGVFSSRLILVPCW